jgi:hypothetical protein
MIDDEFHYGVDVDVSNVDNRVCLNIYTARIIINISRNEENFKMLKQGTTNFN